MNTAKDTKKKQITIFFKNDVKKNSILKKIFLKKKKSKFNKKKKLVLNTKKYQFTKTKW